MANCRISYVGKQAVVTNENGTPSRLFNEALIEKQNQDVALEMWAMSTTDDFEKYTGVRNRNDEVTLKQVEEYYNAKVAEDTNSLSVSETYEVTRVMEDLGVSNLAELQSKLQKIFRKNGYTQLDPQEALDSKLYLSAELSDIDIDKIADLINKIDKHLLSKGNILTTDNYTTQNVYYNTDKKTILGTFQRVTEEDVYAEIKNGVENFQDREGFNNFIKNSPFETTVTEDELYDKFKNYKRLPVLAEVEDGLIFNNADTFQTLYNTLPDNLDQATINVKIDFITKIDEFIWDDQQANVKKVIYNLEKYFTTQGIDIIGLNEKSTNREAVITFLNTLRNFTNRISNGENISTQDIQDFAKVKDEALGVGNKTIVSKQKPSDLNKNIVSVSTSLNEEEAYTKHGLLHISGNNYHKVKRETVDNLYDFLSENLVNGTVQLEGLSLTEEDKLSERRENTKNKVKEYVSKIPSDYTTEVREELILQKLIWDSGKVTNTTKESVVSNIKTLAQYPTGAQLEYFSGAYLQKIYKDILENKIANTELYNKIYKSIGVGNDTLTMLDNINPKDLDLLPESDRKLFVEFLTVTKDENFKKLLAPAINNDNYYNQDLLSVNYPNTLRETNQPTVREGNYIIAEKSTDNVIKVGGKLYFKKLIGKISDLYALITNKISNTFLQKDIYTDYDKKQALEVLRKYDTKSEKTIDIQALNKEMNFSFSQEIKNIFDRTKNKDKTPEKNLIEYIRQKGVKVVTNKKEVEKVLKEAGIENFNAIGEKGATQLGVVEENNFRSEALLEARKLEMLLGLSPNDWKKSKYRTEDKLKVKRATGWERNGEGAWVYEANNIEFKNVNNILDAMLSDKEIIINFEDVLAKGDIVNAYPNIINLKLKIYTDEKSSTNGYFNKETGEIGINRRGFIEGFSEHYTGKISKRFILNSTNNLRGLLRGTLSHEIAHFIQNEEGLQGGGNTLKLFIDLGLTTDGRIDKKKTIQYIDEKIASIESQINVIEGIAGGKTLEKIQKINKEAEYRDLLTQLGKYGQWRADPTSDIVSRPYYESLVGEVGARNESKRFLMTPEERRNNLLEETEDIPRENQVNFLQTPAGNVLGFEKNGVIYLDEEQLNDTTTIHELLHIWQSVLELKASKGDKKAQDIIAKRQELFQPIVDEWKNYHKNNKDGKRRYNTFSEFTREVLQMRELQGELSEEQGGIGLLREVFGGEIQEALGESGSSARGDSITRISRKLRDIVANIDTGIGDIDSKKGNEGYTRTSLQSNYGEGVISKLKDVDFRNALAEDIFFTLKGQPLSKEAQQLKDTLGLDLSSPAYAQRSNESSEEWNIRLLKEVEAYVTAPKVSEQLEELRKENPSLWQQITDYIKQLTDWLKSQIGLSDYKGNIMDMTKEEYVSALGISVLKDDYSSTQSAESFNAQIIGQQALKNSKEISEAYQKALDLEKQGASETEIEKQTRWYKEAGDWKYFSKEILNNYKFKTNELELDREHRLEEIVENKFLFQYCPQLKDQKVKIYDGSKIRGSQNDNDRLAKGIYRGGVILLNSVWEDDAIAGAKSFDDRREALDKYGNIERNGKARISSKLGSTLAHETQHIIQRIEGFPVGGDLETVYKKGLEILNLTELDTFSRIKEVANNYLLGEKGTKEERDIVSGTLWYSDNITRGMATPMELYTNLLGEVEARSLEYILNREEDWLNKTYSELREEFERVENIFKSPKYIVRNSGGEALSTQAPLTYQQKQDLLKKASQILAYNIKSVPLLSEQESLDILDKINDCE